MKTHLLILTLLFVGLGLSAQNKCQYYNRTFSEIEKSSAVYSTAPSLSNHLQGFYDMGYFIEDGEEIEYSELQMDIYQPKGDISEKRPAIIFVHGGEYVCGSKNCDDMVAMCDTFAHHGYVTASINYRLGANADVVYNNSGFYVSINITEKSSTYSAVRTIQDCKAAVSYLRANAKNWRIDPNKIYMVGSNCGAIASIHNIYLNSEKEMPAIVEDETLRNINAYLYNNVSGRANAVVSLWGGIYDLNMINQTETEPILLIHGTADKVVPFGYGKPIESLTSYMQSFVVDAPATYGSKNIANYLKNNLDSYYETYFVQNASNEFYGTKDGNFNPTPNAYWDTIIERINTFFSSVINSEYAFDYEISENTISVNAKDNCEFINWDFGDGTLSNEKSTKHSYSGKNEYCVKMYFAIDGKKYVIARRIDLSPNNEIKKINNNLINISNDKLVTKETIKSLTITNNLGQTIAIKNDLQANEEIDLSNLPKGIYWITIKNSEGITTESFVAE